MKSVISITTMNNAKSRRRKNSYSRVSIKGTENVFKNAARTKGILHIDKLLFQNIVKTITMNLNPSLKFQSAALGILQVKISFGIEKNYLIIIKFF